MSMFPHTAVLYQTSTALDTASMTDETVTRAFMLDGVLAAPVEASNARKGGFDSGDRVVLYIPLNTVRCTDLESGEEIPVQDITLNQTCFFTLSAPEKESGFSSVRFEDVPDAHMIHTVNRYEFGSIPNWEVTAG